MKNTLTKNVGYATALTLTVLSASHAAAVLLAPGDKLTLNITFHTQAFDIDTTHSVVSFKIVDTTLDTADVLKILAEDLGVTSHGKVGFPPGSYLLLSDGVQVQSLTGQTWDVSAYLQYSLAADIALARGTVPLFPPTYLGEPAAPFQTGALHQPLPAARPLLVQTNMPVPFPIIYPGELAYTSLVHIHFEDANHLADFTGFANTQGGSWDSAGTTSISSAAGSGNLDGKPALITAQAELKQ